MLKKLLSQTVLYGLSSIVGRLLNYLLVPFYTRVLLPGEYGIISDLMAWVSFMLVVYSYGMETSFFRFVNKPENDKHTVYGTILSLVTFSSLLLSALIIGFNSTIAKWAGHKGHGDYVLYLAIILALDTISAIQFAWLRKQEQALRFALIRIFNIGLNIALNLYFIGYLRYDISYILISNVITSALTTIILLPLTLPKKIKVDYRLIKNLLWYGSPLLIAGLAGMANENLDRMLLRRYLPDTYYQNYTSDDVAGIYSACYKLSIFISLAVQAFRYGAEPFYFRQAQSQNAPQLYARIMDYFLPACLWICLAITAFLPEIGSIIGSKYRSGLFIVPILLLANTFLGVSYNLTVWYKLTQRTHWAIYLSGIGAIITILFNILWIPKYGMAACAWTTLICYSTIMVLSYYFGQRFYPIPYKIKRLLGYIGLTILLLLSLSYFPTQWNIYLQYGFKLLCLALFTIVFLKIEGINPIKTLINLKKRL